MVKVRGFKPQGIDNPLLNTGAKPHREIDGELSLAIAKLASKPRLTVEEYQARLRKKEEEENKRIDEWDAKYGEEYRRKLAEDREKVLNPQKSQKKKRHRHRHHKKKHGSSSSSSSSSSPSSSSSDESDTRKESSEKGKGPWKLSAFFQATDDSKKHKEKDKDKKKRHHRHKYHSKHHHRHHSKHRSHSKRKDSSEASESSRSDSDKSSSSNSVPEKKAKFSDENNSSNATVGVGECPDIKTPPTPSSPQQK